jgi:peptidoglycan hydrolase CwlO-like protein
MTAPSPLTQSHHDVLKASISDLKVLHDQLTGIDDLDDERAAAQAKLDETKRYLKQAQGEVKEALYFRDKYMAEAREKAAECERLTKEIAEKSAQVAQVNDYIAKLRAKLAC